MVNVTIGPPLIGVCCVAPGNGAAKVAIVGKAAVVVVKPAQIAEIDRVIRQVDGILSLPVLTSVPTHGGA